ncbi:hypothetical protein HUA76_06445 [Myxococcus sp. CA056]|uniref:hypothetical protein n=1 Tax=Myxococcus sp. CA056 TaxID=2741740 RepID=UPI00157AC834|nr:hypothetical protein [Myxococcus sp. CA056]NTX10419.1 hypothetical protein [Myxococcus sp. CA056]
MSVTLPPNLARPPVEQSRTGVVRVPVAGPSAETETQPAAPVAKLEEQPADAYGAQEASRQAWSQRFTAPTAAGEVSPATARIVSCVKDMAEAAPALGGWDEDKDPSVLEQTKDVNCGSAVAVMLGKAKGTGTTAAASDQQTMDALESRFTDGNGTTAHELSNMIAHEGAQVTQSASTFDRGLMDEALKRDGKAAVLVDSNKVDPSLKDAGKGRAHWVTVDGKDDQGKYKVKDPGTGKTVSLDAGELEDAVGTSWREHQGGGMLVIDKAEGTTEAQRAEQGGHKVAALGNTEGGGSRSKSNFARESS